MFRNIMGRDDDEAALVVAIPCQDPDKMSMSLPMSGPELSARACASLSNINLFVDIEISADFAVVQHFSSCQNRILYSFFFQSRTNDTL